VFILKNVEFLYNNLIHTIINVSLFFTLYNYHLNAGVFIKKEVLKGDILIAKERKKEIVIMYKMLSK
jgi:hypothetical protein